MGMNTIAILYESQLDDWALPLHQSHAAWLADSSGFPRPGAFHFGHALTRVEPGTVSLVACQGNTGGSLHQMLSSRRPRTRDAVCHALRETLRGHGFTVRRPGRSRGEGPFDWGYARNAALGTASTPGPSGEIAAPGAGFAVILLNDLSSEWPKEILHAMRQRSARDGGGSFGYGRVIQTAHADMLQLVGISGTRARALRPDTFAENEVLLRAMDALRRQGHAIKAPGQKDYLSPLP